MKKRLWDGSGASEVIGTMLTLVLTVALFSTAIIFVGNFPVPNQKSYVSFTGTFVPGTWASPEIVVSHIGGDSLAADSTRIILDVNSTPMILNLKGGSNPWLTGNDDNWDPGEQWHYTMGLGDAGPTTRISVSIIDLSKNSVVWSSQLLGGGNPSGPIIMEAWADRDPATILREPILPGSGFAFYVRITDPDNNLDTASVRASFASLGMINNPYTLTSIGNGIFAVTVTENVTVRSSGYYGVAVSARDLDGYAAERMVAVIVGQDPGGKPQIVATSVDTDPEAPVHGDTVSLRARIDNLGGGWADVNVSFYDNGVWIGSNQVGVGGWPDGFFPKVGWFPKSSGNHNITVTAVVIDSAMPEDPADLWDNTLSVQKMVLPTILLVDDDATDPTSTTPDPTSYMREALTSGGFDYNLYLVSKNKDGPAYGYGDYDLKSYDIVIWMLGYQTVNTLTEKDQRSLENFTRNAEGGDRYTGKLWLVGQGWLGDANVSNGFRVNTLHIGLATPANPVPTNPLAGNPGNVLGSNWPSLPVSGSNAGYVITPDGDARTGYMFNHSGGGADAITFDNGSDERLVTYPWEFSRITNIAEQSNMVYKVILWLGNLNNKEGIDFAVASQAFSRTVVYYKDIVTVTAVIRNNGLNASMVPMGIYLDGGLTPLDFLDNVTVPGMGGEYTYAYNWTASVTGRHSLVVRVDPEKIYDETNENNNEVAGFITSTYITVQFRLLVVDDGPNNETASVMSALYAFQCNNNTYIVNGTSVDGPSYSDLNNYSGVLWVVGDSTSGLTANDQTAISQYLSAGGRFWLHGAGAAQSAANLSGAFGINGSYNSSLSTYVTGTVNDPVGHGMYYHTTGGACKVLNVTTGTAWLKSGTANVGVRVEGAAMTALTSFSLNSLGNATAGEISGTDAGAEMAYLALHWLGRPEERSELRVSAVDITISDVHPQIGGAYVLKATVRNQGGYDEANALVRFLDSGSLIGSQVLGVTPDNRTSAEMVWIPLASGPRTITVQVDPLNEQAEVFEWFNNNASVSTYVYFFYDDMENGTAKWAHYSTVANINGETPLDFLPYTYTRTDTGIANDWDVNMSSGVWNTTEQYKSYPRSFKMNETTGNIVSRPTVDVCLVLDESQSMRDLTPDGLTKNQAMENAANSFVMNLSTDSRVAIFGMQGQNPITRLTFTTVGTGLSTIMTTINGSGDSSVNTPLWDLFGLSFEYGTNNSSPNRTLAIVGLTDGEDCQGTDVDLDKRERGSDDYAPWAAWVGSKSSYNDHQGKYSSIAGNPGVWQINSGNPAFPTSRYGMFNWSFVQNGTRTVVKTYTLAFGVEHHDRLAVSTARFPNGFMGTYAQYAVSQAEAGAVYRGAQDDESGTVEFNMWRIANTTGAKYYYAATGAELSDAFIDIASQLTGGFNQTRAVAPPTNTINEANADKIAISPPLNLSGYNSARLSFWTKYNMLQGGNGGVLGFMVNDSGTWKFKYVVPSGVYSGGLYYLQSTYDNFSTQVKWCFNGVSGQGTFAWDYVDFDLMPFILSLESSTGRYFRNGVRLAFKYVQYGGGTGVGWYIDDVQLRVFRNNTQPDASVKDMWNLTNMGAGAHSGSYAWWNVDTGGLRPGIDNSLETAPIDLTFGLQVTLNAYFKFNVNTSDGMPPDCFRVEVTADNGLSWSTLTLGVRSCWNVSGIEPSSTDGNASDGKSYSGLTDTGIANNNNNVEADNYWVSAGSLNRLNVDLSQFVGSQVKLRFRMVVNNATYNHYSRWLSPPFYGFMIDDVTVTGTTSNV
ncbi:MAG: type IV pilin [Euryarchaeota archaeon]|nr:type IV pilin [Euryarchaeota archaeon]